MLQPGHRRFLRTDTGTGQEYCNKCENGDKFGFSCFFPLDRICLHVYEQESFSNVVSYLQFTESDNPGVL